MKKENDTDLSDELWNINDTESFNNETYHVLLVEQYKLYVEMTDRISARRNLANTYFLTMHAIVLSVLGITLSHQQAVHRVGFLLFPLLGLLVLCYGWWRLVQYFRRVTSARNKVIIELEKRMPSSPSMQAERKAMGKDNPYKPLKSMEVALPIIFALIYIFSFIYATHLT
ncbi:MAG: hypothetical protein K0S29_1331 [Gammaproteobacteria bacterium]|jgi:hypothetical protein|nr:hypothetical protein [Gammaproteobacteria bacterium]